MTIGFFLKAPSAERTSILCIVRHNGALYKKSVGVVVESKYWNKNTHSCRSQGDYAHAASMINTRLQKWHNACNAVCMEMASDFSRFDNAEFWRRVDVKLQRKDAKAGITFTSYIPIFIERREKSFAKNTITAYMQLHRRLIEYEHATKTKITFDRINVKFYDSFKAFILSRGYSINSFVAFIKNIKAVYRAAREVDKLHEFRETETAGFSVLGQPPMTVYLTVDELKRIADIDISPDKVVEALPELYGAEEQQIERQIASLDATRKKFLIGAYTGLRISDYNQITTLNIDDRFIRVKTRKTGANVVIPIHPAIRDILTSGFDVTTRISEAAINKNIKILARMAGITDVVQGNKRIGHNSVLGYYPKCDLVTSHTARRSAATNMYKAGIPSISIMKITGHKTEESFMRYIRITQEENAEILAQNAYFR